MGNDIFMPSDNVIGCEGIQPAPTQEGRSLLSYIDSSERTTSFRRCAMSLVDLPFGLSSDSVRLILRNKKNTNSYGGEVLAEITAKEKTLVTIYFGVQVSFTSNGSLDQLLPHFIKEAEPQRISTSILSAQPQGKSIKHVIPFCVDESFNDKNIFHSIIDPPKDANCPAPSSPYAFWLRLSRADNNDRIELSTPSRSSSLKQRLHLQKSSSTDQSAPDKSRSDGDKAYWARVRFEPTSHRTQEDEMEIETRVGTVEEAWIVVDGQTYLVDSIYGAAKGDSGEMKSCCICLTNPVDTLVVPCRHVCLCRYCAPNAVATLGTCPICRSDVKEIVILDAIGEKTTDRR